MDFSLLIGLLLLGSGFWIYKLHEDNDSLQKRLHRYSNLISQENFEAELTERIDEHQEKYSYLNSQVNSLKQEFNYFKGEMEFQSNGLSIAEEIAIFPDDIEAQLNKIRLEQKWMKDNQTAIVGPSWAIIGQKEGVRLLKDLKQAILVTFNEKCTQSISKVRANNFESPMEGIQKSYRSLNKIANLFDHYIDENYLKLKEEELRIQYGYKIQVKEKEEEEKEERDRQRKEREIKRSEDLIQAKEEEEDIYQQKLAEINKKLELNYENKLTLAEEEKNQAIQEAEAYKLAVKNLQEEIQKEKSQIIRYKRGFIFVLSNIGSFGEGVYRICSTTSDDDENYIRIMNRHVPFPFDIHLQILSEDVDSTISQLNSRFENKRCNRVNLSRQFFKVSLIEVWLAIEEIYEKTGMVKNFIISEMSAPALQFHKTMNLNKDSKQ